MIYNLQMLRGLAALGVVFYHTGYQIVPGISTEFFGVATFFAISGFILTHVTRTDSRGFLAKRFIRVVPLYWLVSIAFFAMIQFGLLNVLYTIPTLINLAGLGFVHLMGWFRIQAEATLTPAAGWHLLESLLFLPSSQKPVLGVGWTLNYEMFFYVVFAIALALSRKWAPLIATGALLIFQGVGSALDCGPVCSTYGSNVTSYFVVGIGSYYVWITLRDHASAARRSLALVSGIVAIVTDCICITWGEPPTIVPIMVVAGVILTALERGRRTDLSESLSAHVGRHVIFALSGASDCR